MVKSFAKAKQIKAFQFSSHKNNPENIIFFFKSIKNNRLSSSRAKTIDS